MKKIGVKVGDESFVYRKCPSMTEKQQCITEYSLPLVLPAMFYLLNLSPFAIQWCLAIVLGHTIETTLTNFGHSVKCFRISGPISPLLHHFLDCGWLHTLISAMFLKPSHFTIDSKNIPENTQQDISFLNENEWNVIYMALLLIQTLRIYLAVSLKPHYLRQQKRDGSALCARSKNASVSPILGLHIQQCFLWYLVATGWLFIASFSPGMMWRIIGVFVLNVVPVCLFKKYSSDCNLKNKKITNDKLSNKS